VKACSTNSPDELNLRTAIRWRRETAIRRFAVLSGYYDGSLPPVMKFGSAWPRVRFELVENTTEIAPGIHLISLVSDKPGTLELRELSLAIETPDGLVLVVGCSHPGIEKVLQAAVSIDKHVHPRCRRTSSRHGE
jgi:hypothetical protein